MNFHISYNFFASFFKLTFYASDFAVWRYNILYLCAGCEYTKLGQTKQSFIPTVAIATIVIVLLLVVLVFFLLLLCSILCLSHTHTESFVQHFRLAENMKIKYTRYTFTTRHAKLCQHSCFIWHIINSLSHV